jgi:hypothetical protein
LLRQVTLGFLIASAIPGVLAAKDEPARSYMSPFDQSSGDVVEAYDQSNGAKRAEYEAAAEGMFAGILEMDVTRGPDGTKEICIAGDGWTRGADVMNMVRGDLLAHPEKRTSSFSRELVAFMQREFACPK